MTNDIILLKLGEIVLKGLNRRSFEQKLMSNIKRRLERIGNFKTYLMQSTVYIEALDETGDIDAAFEAMTKVFGDKVDGKYLTDLYGIKSSFLKNTDWYSTLTVGISYEFGPRCATCHRID